VKVSEPIPLSKSGNEGSDSETRCWSVYVLLCRGGSYYTGIAKDVAARFEKHRQGKGAAYTRINPPEKLLYQENGLTRPEALVREAQIKSMPRRKKEELVREK